MVRPYTQGQPKLLFTFFVLEVVLRQVLTLVVLQSIHLWSGRALPTSATLVQIILMKVSLMWMQAAGHGRVFPEDIGRGRNVSASGAQPPSRHTSSACPTCSRGWPCLPPALFRLRLQSRAVRLLGGQRRRAAANVGGAGLVCLGARRLRLSAGLGSLGTRCRCRLQRRVLRLFSAAHPLTQPLSQVPAEAPVNRLCAPPPESQRCSTCREQQHTGSLRRGLRPSASTFSSSLPSQIGAGCRDGCISAGYTAN